MVETQQPKIWCLGILFSVIATVAVMLRFKARQIMRQKLGVDDWTILISLILGFSVTTDILIMTKLGSLGTHEQYTDDGIPVNPHQLIVFAKTTYALEILTWPALGMTKISVLLLYRRIFATQRFQLVACILIGLVIAWTVTFMFALMFSCLPIARQWNPEINATCVDQKSLFTAALASDVSTDFLVLLLPIYKLWTLHMPLSRRLSVIFIFLLGGLVSLVGIIRIHFLTQIYSVLTPASQHKRIASVAGADTTWIYAPVFYWTIIETNVGILCACLPTLLPIQERAVSSIKSLLSISSSNTSSSSLKSSGIRLNDLNSLEEGLISRNKTTPTIGHRPLRGEDTVE